MPALRHRPLVRWFVLTAVVRGPTLYRDVGVREGVLLRVLDHEVGGVLERFGCGLDKGLCGSFSQASSSSPRTPTATVASTVRAVFCPAGVTDVVPKLRHQGVGRLAGMAGRCGRDLSSA